MPSSAFQEELIMANPMHAITTYLRTSWAELKKVSWPSRDMTVRYSAIVVAVSLSMATLFAVLDMGFSHLVRIVISAARSNAPAAQAPATEQPVIPDLQDINAEASGNFEVAPTDGASIETVPGDATAPILPTGNGEFPIQLPPVQ